jgi:uncharacterized protein YtpQ (UPF0354 family)
VRAALILAACLALLAATAGCSDKSTPSAQRPLGIGSFKEKAAAAIITGSDLMAEPGFGSKVDVTAPESLNTLSLRVDEAYAAYKRDPAKLDELLENFADDANTRLARGNADTSFRDVRDVVLPVLKPQTAFRRLSDLPAVTPFPGNLRVAYAVQKPDSFMLVTPADLERWQQSVADIHRLALANLLRETRREEPLRCEEQLCGWASGDGYDAARLVVPELRAAIVRRIGPAVYAVPRESVYVALPIRLAERIKGRVEHDFVTAPNPVSRDLFVERGGELVVLAR